MISLIKLNGLPAFQSLFYRSQVSLLFNSLYLVYIKQDRSINPLSLSKEYPLSIINWVSLVLRGILGIFGTSFYFSSIQYLMVSESVSLVLIYPILAPIFTYVFLNEPYSIVDLLFTLLGFIGVLFITRPSFLFSDSTE